ncbi:MAG: RsmD family RNA methyltransferase, partial [Anaerolineales bacterium]|nr:RsmD family RNA methyltransferase [Anaerolineales bacterium]
AFQLLKSNLDKKFEYIYIAPPQYEGMWLKALKLVDENIDWLTEDGTAIVQIDPTEYEKVELKNLVEAEERKYGSTLLIFYDKK